MTVNKYVNITVSFASLCFVLLIALKYCSKKTYTQTEIDAINTSAYNNKKNYEDSLNFVRGQLDLQQEKSNAQTERVEDLEKFIDSLTAKHVITKTKLEPLISDTGFVLAPNEYVTECEGCFDLLSKYKKENIQLRFERDSYDTLMRQQNKISEDRVMQLDFDNIKLRTMLSQTDLNNRCDTTRKLKFSVMGMFGNPFLPKGGGAGLIYEDKKFSEYGAHFLLTNDGPVYMIHIAKTISFKRKK